MPRVKLGLRKIKDFANNRAIRYCESQMVGRIGPKSATADFGLKIRVSAETRIGRCLDLIFLRKIRFGTEDENFSFSDRFLGQNFFEILAWKMS